jgi:hypothetical protein
MAGFITCPALDAFIFIQVVGLASWSGNGLGRTDFHAAMASGTLLLDDPVFDQIAANRGRTTFIFDMGEVFLPEVLDGRAYRVWCRLPQSAERALAYGIG